MGFGEAEAAVHLDREAVDTVNHCRYLGSEVISNGRLDEELKIRIGHASGLKVNDQLVAHVIRFLIVRLKSHT